MPIGDKRLTGRPPEWNDTAPGMAFWAGSGPADKVCRQCKFRGVWRETSYNDGSAETFYRFYGCEKFKQLTGGEWGPVIAGTLASCKYFEPKTRKKRENRDHNSGENGLNAAAGQGAYAAAEGSAERPNADAGARLDDSGVHRSSEFDWLWSSSGDVDQPRGRQDRATRQEGVAWIDDFPWPSD